jgi:hypothetical protein
LDAQNKPSTPCFQVTAPLFSHFLAAGESEKLFEQFEELHSGLFNVTVSFFAAFSVLIFAVNKQFVEWDNTFRHEVINLRLAEDEVNHMHGPKRMSSSWTLSAVCVQLCVVD